MCDARDDATKNRCWYPKKSTPSKAKIFRQRQVFQIYFTGSVIKNPNSQNANFLTDWYNH